jgi:hypothetical protein
MAGRQLADAAEDRAIAGSVEIGEIVIECRVIDLAVDLRI